MLCRKPYSGWAVPVPCGQCLPCRINKRRVWTARQVLESQAHSDNSFLTLTYDQENLPADGSVDPRHLQLFLKRFRRRIEPRRLRFVAIGEYGDESWRPHYHASLFGVSTLDVERVRAAWPFGHVMLAEFNEHTAQYVSGYVIKKMTSKEDPRLKGLHPEFPRYSNRPGIGATAIQQIAEQLKDVDLKEVPNKLLMGRKSLPLGRYLHSKLKKELLTDEQIEEVKQQWVDEQAAEVLRLYTEAKEAGKLGAETSGSLVSKADGPRMASLEARQRIFASKGSKL